MRGSPTGSPATCSERIVRTVSDADHRDFSGQERERPFAGERPASDPEPFDPFGRLVEFIA
jgi:hypothetical protein